MSESDSFINEVTEEVRRDRLFALFRRYGWIAVTLVVLLVLGAAFREYRAAQERAVAEAVGDGVLRAVRETEPARRADILGQIPASGEAAAVVGFLAAGTELEAGNRDAAAARLERLVADPALSPRYRDLAALQRLIVLDGIMPGEERIAGLTPLAVPGAPYRLLAEEQIALAEVELGRTGDAVARLKRIVEDQETTRGLARRAGDMIVALGGDDGDGSQP